jgi:hypothetical protein
MSKKAPIWERQPDETAKAYEAFNEYLLMSDRSLRSLLNRLDKPSTYLAQLGAWSSRYSWVERVTAYDEHLLARERDEYEKTRLKVRKNRQDIVQTLQSFMSLLMKEVQNTKNIDTVELERFSRIAKNVLDQSRQEFNDLATQKLDHSGGIRLENLLTGALDGDDENENADPFA